MTDEQKAENENVQATDGTESPAVEPKEQPEVAPAEETPQEEPKEVSEVTEEVKEEAKPEVKPVEKRIHKLVDERDRERERAESLARQVEELTGQITGNQGVSPQQYTPTVQPGTEVTPEQYQADIARQADAIVQMRLNQERIVNTINKEAAEAMKLNPELDPTSEVFDKELSDTIVEAVKAQVQVNPSASVKKLVNQMMKPYRRSIEKKVAETTETITKQVSESALRPSQVKPQEKPFDQLTPKEMEEKLGIVW
jgi:hypothetical protein